MAQAAEILFGRTTYDMMAAFWPPITDPADPAATAVNTRPRHVVPATLTDPVWMNADVIGLDEVAALKDRPGRELQVHGSCGLVHALHAAGLVGRSCTPLREGDLP